MDRKFSIAVLVVTSTLFAGCSQGAVSSTSSAATNAVPMIAHSSSKAALGAKLYVLNLACPNQITIYSPGQTSPSRAIDLTKCPSYFSAFTFDAQGDLYGAISQGSRVRVYPPGESSPVRTVSKEIKWPVAVVTDRVGRLFVSNQHAFPNPLTVYSAGKNQLLRSTNAYGTQLLVDQGNDLYANNGSEVGVFAQGGRKALYDIENGDGHSKGALDPSNNFYFSNAAANTITVYKAHSKKVLRTITQGVSAPGAIAFDASGNLYCANQGNVTVYAPGASSPYFTITGSINQPNSLAFDSSGNLYVSNAGANNVTVYAPGNATPSETITDGINQPQALSFGP